MEYLYQVNKSNYKKESYLFNITLNNFFKLLSSDQKFRNIIINIFVNSEFKSVYWQFPVYSASTKDNIAHFDLIKCESFKSANPCYFADKFIGKIYGEIIMFKNKSGDTDLISIVPTKFQDVNYTFSDIMKFMINSDHKLKSNMLKELGAEMLKKTNPCYLSTHGRGVEWIHIRLSNKPKYFV